MSPLLGRRISLANLPSGVFRRDATNVFSGSVHLHSIFHLTGWPAKHKSQLWIARLGRIGQRVSWRAKRTTQFGSVSGSCSLLCFRYDTVSGRPSRIQPFKWPILKENPSIFGWDMTQNILFPFWVISQPKVDGFCSNMGHFKGWILLGRPDTVSYRKHNNEHDTEPVSLSVSSSRIFF